MLQPSLPTKRLKRDSEHWSHEDDNDISSCSSCPWTDDDEGHPADPPLCTLEQASLALSESVLALSERVIERPWGGSGDSCVVGRVTCSLSDQTTKPIICKRVYGPSHRHPDDPMYTAIKALSYKVEINFLRGCTAEPNIARALLIEDMDPTSSLLVLEDLVARGFTRHVTDLSMDEAICALRWLGQFHARPPASASFAVWRCGGYWSLDKRQKDFEGLEASWMALRQANEFLDALPESLGRALAACSREAFAVLYPHAALEFTSASADLLLQAEQWPPRVSHLTKPVLLHGDFKAENIFFSSSSSMAAIDFQWTGFGLGAVDVFNLLSTSLMKSEAEESGGLSPAKEQVLLHEYCSSFGTGPSSVDLLSFLYDLALVDFCRFIVGTGDVFEEDVWLLQRANRVTKGIEGRGGVRLKLADYNLA